jgi:hypothetical protein
MGSDMFRHSNAETDGPNSTALMHADKIGTEIRGQFRRCHIHPEKLSPALRDLAMRSGVARVHPEKLSAQTREFFAEIDRYGTRGGSPRFGKALRRAQRDIDDEGNEWLLVDGRFADVYMAALAALLAKEIDVAALTNESTGVNLHTMLEDVKPSSESNKKRRACVIRHGDAPGRSGNSCREDFEIQAIKEEPISRTIGAI